MATRYWVGGSGNWNTTSTTNWSASSGGASGASAPTSIDDVVFDVSSNVGTGTFTVSVTGTNIAPSLCASITASGLDGAMTLSLSATSFLDSFGSITLPATNFTWTGVGGSILRLRGTGSYTITTNGVTITSTAIASIAQGTCTLGSALTHTGSIDWQQGTFNTANFNVSTLQLLFQTANARTFNAGSSTITSSANAAFNYIGSNLTFNAGTSSIVFTSASPNLNAGAGLTFYNVSFPSAAAGTVTITGANTFNNVTFTSRSVTGFKGILFTANQVINGTLTFGTANTAIRRLFVSSNSNGTQRTLTVATIATIADVDFKDIAAAGASGTWSGTRIGDGGNNSNITTATPKTVYWNLAGTQNWSAVAWATTNTGAPNVNNFPLAQDTATFTEAGTVGTVTIETAWLVGTIQMADGVSNRTTAFTLNTTAIRLFGDITLFSNLVLTGTQAIIFNGHNVTQNITSAGITFTQALQISITGSASVKLIDNLVNSSGTAFNLAQGALDLNNNILTCVAFNSNSSSVRSIAFGTGLFTITGNDATVWTTATSTNLTITGTPVVAFAYTGSVGTRIITAGSSVRFNFYITAGTDIISSTGTTGYGILDFTGFAGTFDNAPRLISGNLIFSSGMTLSAGASALTFDSTSGTQQITTNGITLDFPVTQNGGGGTVQLQDNLTIGSTRTLLLTAGTFDTNDNNVSTGVFNSNNSNTRSLLMGSGTWTLTSTGVVWAGTTTTGMTLVPSTSTIVFNGSGNGSFNGGGLTFNNLTQSSSNVLTIGGSNTFNTISNTVQPTTITLNIGTTQTVNDFNVNGTAGNLVTINSSTAGTQANLSKASGTVNVSYVSLQDNNATGGAIWQAPSNQGNVIVSNVTGWFTSALYADSITENSRPADASTTQTSFNRAITENVNPADVSTVYKGVVSAITENLRPDDASATQANFNSTITENSRPADTSTIQASFNSAITENLRPADISTVYKGFFSVISEPATLADAQTVQAIYQSSASEDVQLADTTFAQFNFNSFVNENMIMFEQSVGYGWFKVVDSQTVTWINVNDSQTITWTDVNDTQNPNWVQINSDQP
jgi:hypothetical protein